MGSFWEDPIGNIQQAFVQPGVALQNVGNAYVQAVQGPYWYAGNKAAEWTGSKEVAVGARIFNNSYAPSTTYGLSPGLIKGVGKNDWNDARAEKKDWLVGATVASGVAGASALAAGGGAASTFWNSGKVESSSILKALGVNADLANYFPDIDTQPNKDKNSSAYESYESGAPATPFRMPDNAGDYVIPIAIAGGVALLAVLLLGRKK